LLVLLKGEEGQAYNIANEKTEISIYDMAKMLSEEYTDGAVNVRIQLEADEKHGFNPVARTCIRCDKLHALGWRAEVGLKEAYERMMKSMKMGRKRYSESKLE
jgi:nucleoside-diphosphate-sugar epimerase